MRHLQCTTYVLVTVSLHSNLSVADEKVLKGDKKQVSNVTLGPKASFLPGLLQHCKFASFCNTGLQTVWYCDKYKSMELFLEEMLPY
jgi:hypothetical protein